MDCKCTHFKWQGFIFVNLTLTPPWSPTWPTCWHHNHQSPHDKLPSRVSRVSHRERDIKESSRFSRQSVLTTLSVHLGIAGHQHQPCAPLKGLFVCVSAYHLLHWRRCVCVCEWSSISHDASRTFGASAALTERAKEIPILSDFG